MAYDPQTAWTFDFKKNEKGVSVKCEYWLPQLMLIPTEVVSHLRENLNGGWYTDFNSNYWHWSNDGATIVIRMKMNPKSGDDKETAWVWHMPTKILKDNLDN